jgi:predicted dehydrogenase
MPKTITAAVLTNETGAHLGAYFPALAASPEAKRVVLGDPSGQQGAGAKRGLGEKLAKVYRSHAELLATEKPELALVSLESRSAPAVIRQALEAGCHVFAEKPACVKAEDFAELVKLADSKHLHLMLALANRTNPETQVARKLVTGGEIGKVYGIELHIIADQTRLKSAAYRKRWYAQKARAGGGHLAWLGIHWLDLATYLTGTHATHVTGFAANVGGQPLDVEDSAAVALKYANGTLGTLTSGYYLDRGYHTHIKIWGSQGWVQLERVEGKPLTWQSWKPGAKAGVQTWEGSTEPRGYTPFVQAAVKAAAGLADAPISSAESLRALQTVYGLYQAHATGRTQAIG